MILKGESTFLNFLTPPTCPVIATQGVLYGLAALAPPGNFSRMQNLSLTLDPLNQSLHLNKIPRDSYAY